MAKDMKYQVFQTFSTRVYWFNYFQTFTTDILLGAGISELRNFFSELGN